VLLAKSVLKVELFDLLNQGVKMGVAVTRPRRDEPFTVQGIVLYVQLKKYMQLIGFAVDPAYRKRGVARSLNEQFLKATKKMGGMDFVVVDIPDKKEFKNFSVVLQNLGYNVENNMASHAITASKRRIVFDRNIARDSMRRWDALIRPSVKPQASKKKKEKKSSMGTLPKKFLNTQESPVPEACVPSPAREQAASNTTKQEAIEEEPVAAIVLEPVKIEEPAAVEKPVVQEKKVVEKQQEVVVSVVDDTAKNTEVEVVEETKKEEVKKVEETKSSPKKKKPKQEVAKAPAETEVADNPAPASESAPIVPKSPPKVNGVDSKIMKEQSNASTISSANDNAQPEESKKKVWRPSLRGSVSHRAK